MVYSGSVENRVPLILLVGGGGSGWVGRGHIVIYNPVNCSTAI